MIFFFTRYGSKGASSRLRIIQFLPYLEVNKINYRIFPLINDKMLDEFYTKKKYRISSLVKVYILRFIYLLQIPRDAVVVVEKELFPFLPFWLEYYFFKRFKVVLDFDDAIFTFYEQHKNFLIRTFFATKIDQLMAISGTVICGSHFLLERAIKANSKSVKLIPTVVDTNRYKVKHDKSVGIPVIVWIGTPSTIHFIEILRTILPNLALRHLFKFRVIGCLNFNIDGVNVECYDWSLRNEVELLADADIGVMPLYDSDWEKGKCGYKLIQYMASGLPVVASAVGENNFIVASSCGFLVKKSDDWIEYLSILLEQKDLRNQMGKNGRIRAEKIYSQDATKDVWLSTVLNKLSTVNYES